MYIYVYYVYMHIQIYLQGAWFAISVKVFLAECMYVYMSVPRYKNLFWVGILILGCKYLCRILQVGNATLRLSLQSANATLQVSSQGGHAALQESYTYFCRVELLHYKSFSGWKCKESWTDKMLSEKVVLAAMAACACICIYCI